MGSSLNLTYITRQELKTAIKVAYRKGVWFKLEPQKRLILELAARILKIIKSSILIQIFNELLDLIHPTRKLLREAYKIGYKIIRKKVKQALMLGNKNAIKWLKNKKLILAYGLSYLNTPPYYRIEL